MTTLQIGQKYRANKIECGWVERTITRTGWKFQYTQIDDSGNINWSSYCTVDFLHQIKQGIWTLQS